MRWFIRTCSAVGPDLFVYSLVFDALLGVAILVMVISGGLDTARGAVAGLVALGILAFPALRLARCLHRQLRLFMEPVLELVAARDLAARKGR